MTRCQQISKLLSAGTEEILHTCRRARRGRSPTAHTARCAPRGPDNNKVTEAWGSGEEKVVRKNFELLLNAGLSEEQPKDPDLRWCSHSQNSLGQGMEGVFKKFYPPPSCKVPLRSGNSINDAGQRRCRKYWEWATAPPHRRRHTS